MTSRPAPQQAPWLGRVRVFRNWFEAAEALGLTATPAPTLPVEVTTPDGRCYRACAAGQRGAVAVEVAQ